MMSVLLASRRSANKMLFLGSLYIASIFVVYLLAGLGLTYFFASLPLVITEYLSIGVAVFIIGAGIIEIKDFFWYGRWFSLSIPYAISKKLDEHASRTTAAGMVFLGAFVALVELPCTGAPYLAIITLLSQYFDLTAFMMLVLYNLIFVLPLAVILLLVASGKKLQDVQKWKQASKPYMRLFVGLLLVAMGWLLMLIANGTINFG